MCYIKYSKPPNKTLNSIATFEVTYLNSRSPVHNNGAAKEL